MWGSTDAEPGEEKQEEMISMTRRSAARRRPAVNAAPRSRVVQWDKEAGTPGGLTARLAGGAQETLAVTDWLAPAPHPAPHPVTAVVSGLAALVKGRPPAPARF